jgi:NTE family protein
MNTAPSSIPHVTPGERALVLHGGGSAGNAWEIGVIAGLFDAGLDVTEADLIIGTSAGSTAAAQITSATPTELLAAILAAVPKRRTDPSRSDGGRVPIGPVADHMERTSRIIAAAEDAADMRRRMGAAGKRGGALPSQPGCRVSAGRSDRFSSRRSMPLPVNRSCSTATAELT